MKAIILCAGEGTRLRPHTNAVPKCLVEVRGQTMLDRALGVLRASGIDDVVAVVGWCGERVVRPGLKTVTNPRFASTNMVASLFCAREHLQGDVLIVYGDIVFTRPAVEGLLTVDAQAAVGVNTRWRELWEMRMADPLADAETLKIGADGNLVALGQKPRSYADIEGQYMGLISLRAKATEAFLSFYDGLEPTRLYDGVERDRMFMTTFLQLVIDRLMPLRAVPIPGQWLEVDSIEDIACYARSSAYVDEVFREPQKTR